MTIAAKVVLGYLTIALIIFAWMFRLDVKPQGTNFDAL
jgi:hypothetical protein